MGLTRTTTRRQTRRRCLELRGQVSTCFKGAKDLIRPGIQVFECSLGSVSRCSSQQTGVNQQFTPAHQDDRLRVGQCQFKAGAVVSDDNLTLLHFVANFKFCTHPGSVDNPSFTLKDYNNTTRLSNNLIDGHRELQYELTKLKSCYRLPARLDIVLKYR